MEKDLSVKQKRVPVTEFLGKRSEGGLQTYNYPVKIRGWGMDRMGKRHLGMELIVKQTPGRKSFGENTAGRNNLRKLVHRTEFGDTSCTEHEDQNHHMVTMSLLMVS